jgi:phosphoglycolate phosphatase-like HAD superfamily hydrolase
MPEKYGSISTSDGRAWIKPSSLKSLSEVDAVIFDCDGVLVDASKSYDATIAEVVKRILLENTRTNSPEKNVTLNLVRQLRRTGGFNNDWDSTYALILFSIMALPKSELHRLALESPTNGSREPLRISPRDIEKVVDEFCSAKRDLGIGAEAVNRDIQTAHLTHDSASVVAKLQKQLGYPGGPPKSLLSTLFDEIYHGPRLFRKMYGVRAQNYKEIGFIENERLLIRRRHLEMLSRLLGSRRLALVTGRPYLATKHVLRDMMKYFNRRASIFIGDLDVHPKLAPMLKQFRKPSGRSLIHAKRNLSSETLLYVGDSAEDAKMAEDARRLRVPVLFAGIYGTGLGHEEQSKFFRHQGADLVLPTVRQLPMILRAEMK